MSSRWFAVLVGALLLAGCSEPQLGPVDDSLRGPLAPSLDEVEIAEFRCSVDVAAGTLTCGEPAASMEGAAAAKVGSAIIGGQHRYARLVSSGIGQSAGGDTLYASVTVQNLTLQPWATKDGVSPDGEVRVFFSEGPTVTAGSGSVAVVEDGLGIFTASNQPYIGYDAAYTVDGILEPAETSRVKQWKFAKDPTVTEFEFTVLIHATVPDVRGLAVKLTQISAGGGHTCGISADNDAYCWGSNSAGQLGTGDNRQRTLPSPVAGGIKFTKIAAGQEHTCALATTGQAYCWGSNVSGQLGIDGPIRMYEPVAVGGGHVFSQITAGAAHSCAVQANGEAYCWGHNTYGQLGNGVLGSNTSTPQKVAMSGTGYYVFSHLFAGTRYTCGIGTEGRASCWGDDESGQLGNGPLGASRLPSPVAGGHAFITGDAGRDYACAITTSYVAYCWGNGGNGKLGNGIDDSNRSAPTPVDFGSGVTVTDIAAGGTSACAIADGELYCWGSDFYGKLGNGVGTIDDQWSPVPVDLGFVEAFGTRPEPADVTSGHDSVHACAISTAGQAYCWGYGPLGRLGDGTITIHHRPVWVVGTH